MRTTARRPPFLAATIALLLVLLLPSSPAAAAPGAAPVQPAAAPSDATAPFVITTVPPVAGFPVSLDGVTALTDAAGRAGFAATETLEPLEDRVALTEATLRVDQQLVLARADRVYPSATGPLLALDLSYLVSFRFTGADRKPVDPSSVEELTVKSETGEVVDVPPQEPVWLQGSRVIKRTGLMEVKKLRWSVQTAKMSGSNLVNASQQFFLPAERQGVAVELLFFSLHVEVHDAMYGFAEGGAIELTYPDGNTRRFALAADGRLSIPALPRGDYSLMILGAGPSMSRPLAVSRDQALDLDFYSWLDIGTVLGVLLALAGGLLLTGHVRRRRLRAESASWRPLRYRTGSSGRRRGAVPPAPHEDDVVLLRRGRGELAG